MSELAKYIFFYFLRRKSASCTRFSSAACLTGYPSNHINLCSLGQDGVNMKRPFQLHHTFASEKDQGRKGKHYKNVFSHVWKAQMDVRKGENFLQLKIWSSPTQQYHSKPILLNKVQGKGFIHATRRLGAPVASTPLCHMHTSMWGVIASWKYIEGPWENVRRLRCI